MNVPLCVALILASATAVDADPIVPSARLPREIPWDLKKLSDRPAFEWVDASGPVRSLLYQGEPYGGRITRIFAYYATPGSLAGNASRDRALPAVVLIHGGSGTAYREWAESWARHGYAAIAMDLAGHRPAPDQDPHQKSTRVRLPDGGPNQEPEEIFDRIDAGDNEQWPYHAVAAVIRAHSLVRSFAEVDPNRTAATGISWGGYLTCIVAGLDNRFKAAVPVYGCGFLGDNSGWSERFAKMPSGRRERWLSLWDPSHYLPAVSAPILFINGTNDSNYPLDSYMKSFDSVPGAKQIRVTVKMGHSHRSGWAPPEIRLFVDQHLRGGQALPLPGEPRMDGGRVRLTCPSETKIAAAALHLTTDYGPINKREWQTVPATIDGSTITVDALPPTATAWFLTITDERGAIVSSRVVIR